MPPVIDLSLQIAAEQGHDDRQMNTALPAVRPAAEAVV